MTGTGIYDKDIIVVDTSLKAKNNDIVVARIEDEFILKRLVKTLTGYVLKAENVQYPPIELTEYSDCIICGVVTYTIHKP
jgi:DNA polymerase V